MFGTRAASLPRCILDFERILNLQSAPVVSLILGLVVDPLDTQGTYSPSLPRDRPPHAGLSPLPVLACISRTAW